MGRFLNLNLMSNPANWAIVFLMAYIGALALDAITRGSIDNG